MSHLFFIEMRMKTLGALKIFVHIGEPPFMEEQYQMENNLSIPWCKFSAEGSCQNLDRITCSHIVDDNYDNYAKRIHLSQYKALEKNRPIYFCLFFQVNLKQI